MPYLGQVPSKGDDKNFKILDDITTYTLTFNGSDSGVVSAADDTIYEYNHRFVQGQRVTYTNGGGGNIAGLTSGTVYYIIKQDHNNIQLATSESNAAAGTAINLTAVGTGASHTLNVAFDGTNTKFKATHTSGQKARITRGAQLVISINGVIQQPHDSSSPSTGFGFDLDGTIVLSQAPESSDVFWGHILTNNNVTYDISDNTIDHFTGDGSTSSFTLSKSPPNNENILVTIDGVVQYPNDGAGNIRAYSVAANIINFTSAPGSGTAIEVRHIGFAGATSGGGGGVTGFYGRTGNAVLKSTDHITTGNIVAGVVTATNAVITGDLTVNGTTTTLDTDLIGVDKIEVAANNTTVAVAVTQSGSGDIITGFDGSTEVFSVAENGGVGIADSIYHIGDDNTAIRFPAADTFTVETAGDERLRITSSGGVRFPSKTATVETTGITHSTNNYLYVRGGTAGLILSDDDSTNIISINDNNSITFGTNDGSERLHIGETGISTFTNKVRASSFGAGTVPDDHMGLHILQTNPRILIESSGTNAAKIFFGDSSSTDPGVIEYSHSANAMYFGTNNNGNRLEIDSNGYVGVNVTPSARLDVKQDNAVAYNNRVQSITYGAARFLNTSVHQSGGTYTGFQFNLTGDSQNRICSIGMISEASGTRHSSLVFATDDGTNRTEKLRIKSDGKVGIATGDPWSILTAYGENRTDTGSATGQITAKDNAAYDANPTGGLIFQGHFASNNANAVFGGITGFKENATDGNYSGALAFHVRNNGAVAYEALRIDSSGNMGLGTGSGIDRQFHIQGTHPIIKLEDTGGGYSEISANTAVLSLRADAGNSQSSSYINFEVDGTERVRITSDGIIKFDDYDGTTGKGRIEFGNSGEQYIEGYDTGNAGSSSYLSFGAGTAEYLRITSAGNVGVTKTGATRRLHVASDDDLTAFTGGSYGTFAIENSQWDNGDYTAMDFLYNGTNKPVSRIASKITSSGASLHFGVSNSYATGITHEAVMINYEGSVRIGAGSIALPKATQGGVDIDSGAYTVCIGGNVNSSGRTDATDKLNRITSPHRTNAEEPVMMFSAYNQTGTNTIGYGGGSSITNTATDHVFYTAANTTTLAGTERLRIDSSGNIGQAVTPSAWSSAQANDFFAYQVGSGTALFGRGSGDEDRGGISANLYCTASAWKYIANGNAGRIYFEDGNIVFNTCDSGTAGATATLNERLRIHSTGQLELKVPDSVATLKLTPSGTNAPAAIDFNTPGAGPAKLLVQGSEKLRITSTGRVVINKTSGDFDGALHVAASSENAITIEGANAAINWRYQDGSSGYRGGIKWHSNGLVKFDAGVSGNTYYYAFHLNNGERMRLDASGRLGVGSGDPVRAYLDAREAVNNTPLLNLGYNDGSFYRNLGTVGPTGDDGRAASSYQYLHVRLRTVWNDTSMTMFRITGYNAYSDYTESYAGCYRYNHSGYRTNPYGQIVHNQKRATLHSIYNTGADPGYLVLVLDSGTNYIGYMIEHIGAGSAYASYMQQDLEIIDTKRDTTTNDQWPS